MTELDNLVFESAILSMPGHADRRVSIKPPWLLSFGKCAWEKPGIDLAPPVGIVANFVATNSQEPTHSTKALTAHSPRVESIIAWLHRRIPAVVLAGWITAAAGICVYMYAGTGGRMGLVPSLAVMSLWPASLALGMLELGRGPWGLPTGGDASLYLVSFLFWFVIIDAVVDVIRRRQRRSNSAGRL